MKKIVEIAHLRKPIDAAYPNLYAVAKIKARFRIQHDHTAALIAQLAGLIGGADAFLSEGGEA